MKQILTSLFVIAFCVVAKAGDFEVTSTTKTNLSARAWRHTDVYARRGERFLVTEKTSSLDGRTWVLEQSIIWRGQPAAKLTTTSVNASTSHDIRFYTGRDVDAVASWTESGSIRGISLVGSNDEIKIGFTSKDGLLAPLSSMEVERANEAQRDLHGMFDRFIRRDTTGGQFLGEVGAFQAKYGTNALNRDEK